MSNKFRNSNQIKRVNQVRKLNNVINPSVKKRKRKLKKKKGVAYFAYNLGAFTLKSIFYVVMYIIASLCMSIAFLPFINF